MGNAGTTLLLGLTYAHLSAGMTTVLHYTYPISTALILVLLFRARYMAIIPPEAMPPAEPFRPFYAFIPRSWNPWEMFRLYY